MRPGSTVRRGVERVTALGGSLHRQLRRDVLATEEPLEIRVVVPPSTADGAQAQRHAVAVTMRTPGSDFELAAGFLHSEGLLERADQVAAIRYCVDTPRDGPQRFNVVNVHLAPGAPFDPARLQRNFYTTSSCGVCGLASIEAVRALGCAPVESELRIRSEVLVSLPERLRERQAVFERTGGLHAAARFTRAGVLSAVREDVGRHNALDKLLGAALLAGELPLAGEVVLVSGRVSFELVQKAARAGVPVLAGVSAPSSLAVDLAEELGLTLVGFLREGRFNVYAGGWRLVGA